MELGRIGSENDGPPPPHAKTIVVNTPGSRPSEPLYGPSIEPSTEAMPARFD